MSVTLPWVFANLSGNIGAADLDQNFNALAAAVNAIVVSQGVAINAQTGTTYAVQTTDLGKLLTFTNGSAVAVSIAQAVGGFAAPFFFDIACLGSSTGSVTLTSAVSTIDGASTLVLPPGTSCRVVSDGVNYQIQRGIGRIAQIAVSETGVVATGTTALPFDNTIPQNTEGDQYMSLVFVPTNAASTLLVSVIANIASSNTTGLGVALFQDATVGALAAAAWTGTSAGQLVPVGFLHKMLAGTVLSTTFKVRAGAATGATTTFNGSAGGQIYGGVMASSIVIVELLP